MQFSQLKSTAERLQRIHRLHGHHREWRAFPSPGLASRPPERDEADAGRLSGLFLLSAGVPCVSCVCASARGLCSGGLCDWLVSPQPVFKGRSGREVSGLCSWCCQVVPGPLTTALWKRPSVVGLRAVLRDVFRGRHDRNEFFGCLLGRLILF